MDYFIEELKNKKLINKNDILNMKNYIDKKYVNNTEAKKADMLSKTIHHILDTNLSEFNESEKNKIKFNTLKNTIFKNKDSIFMYDLFKSCITNMNHEQSSNKRLLNWVNLNVKNKVSQNSFKNYIENNLPKDKITIKKSKVKRDNKIIDSYKNYVDIEHTSNNISNTQNSNSNHILNIIKSKKVIFSMSLICIFIISILAHTAAGKNIIDHSIYSVYYSQKGNIYLDGLNKITNTQNNLPDYIKYRRIRRGKLKDFLTKRNSLLAKEPYFSTILNTAKEFNINPLLLFAITGQEQDFVPQGEKDANKIANNPFNVFHSWQEYNTNIDDSSKIAARTVINLSKDRPQNADPFLWIGKRYAEDTNWGYGVRSIFKELEK